MDRRTPNFARILAPASMRGDGDFASLRGEEIGAVMELGFMMVNANGDASLDELESFRALVKYLDPSADVASLLDSYSEKLDKAESFEERVRMAAGLLSRKTSRELAFKAVYAVAVFDLETNPEERELEDLIVEVLGLPEARANELALEVTQALST